MRPLGDLPAVCLELAGWSFPEREVDAETAARLHADGRFVRLRQQEEEPARYFLLEAVEHVSAVDSRQGFAATGYIGQYLIDALNETMGLDGWIAEAEYRESAGGVLCSLWLRLCFVSDEAAGGETRISRHAFGFHLDPTDPGNAHKGAFTVAIKRACALFGLGADAYRKQLDPDLTPRGRPTTRPAEAGAANPVAPRETAPVAASNFDKWKQSLSQMGALASNADVGDWWAGVRALCAHHGREGDVPYDVDTQPDGEKKDRVMAEVWRLVSAFREKPRAMADLVNTALDMMRGTPPASAAAEMAAGTQVPADVDVPARWSDPGDQRRKKGKRK